ncbi:hypothetical protein [Polaromonas sp. SM01]|uniref:hypothetical protein n=1 Tax=Polaromonas sp. SM01 TaxID=3085630 RepID=UPI0029817AA2|nr:hypothetical protein [Polaromonas sp. SM01]MDW5441974.1 hypothetical protein [Polaromonas sp. SM01]
MATETVNQPIEDVLKRNSVSGGWRAILNATGIDIRQSPQVMDGSGATVVEHEGRQWTLTPWQGGGGFARVSRALTAEEERLEEEDIARRTYVDFFGLDRLRLCRKISIEMMRVAGYLLPDNPPARAKRRELRKRLDKLAVIQFNLMQYRGTDAKEARNLLNEMGVIGVN